MNQNKQNQLLCLLLTTVRAAGLTSAPEESSFSVPTLLLLGVLLSLLAFLLFDRRQGFLFTRELVNLLRRAWLQLRTRIEAARRRSQEQKLSGEEGSVSSKSTLGYLQAEKTFVDTDRQTRDDSAASGSVPEALQSLEEPSGPVDMKQIFAPEKKRGKEGHRSKSKLRGRVQIKKSELQAESQEQQPSADFSQQLDLSMQEEDPQPQPV